MRRTVLLSLALLPPGLALAQIGPDYERPTADVSAAFKGVAWREGTPSSHLPKGSWWTIYRDAALNDLMERCTANNQDLKAAIARFDQARAAARIARSELLPTSNGTVRGEEIRTSENAVSPIPLNGLFYEGPSYNSLADFGWELDLWGKIRRNVEAGRADFEAAADAVHNLLLALHAELAGNYFTIRALDEEIRLVRQAVVLRGEALSIASARVEAGAGSELEEAQSQTEVATAEAGISGLLAQREQLENSIAILLGLDASAFRIPTTFGRLPAPPVVPAGFPSDLLERRPDIAQAELALAAATARIGVAQAQFFPSVRLIGGIGYQSADLDLLLRPESVVYNYGPSVSLPFFTGGRNRFNLNRAQAAHDEALARYRQSFLAAVADVETSLAALRHQAVQAEALNRARGSAERAASLAKTRYEAGTSPYLDVISANRTVLETQLSATQLGSRRLISSVSLVKALGGGWDPAAPVAMPEVTPDPAARQKRDPERKGWFAK